MYIYDLQKSRPRGDFKIGSLRCIYDSEFGAMYQQPGKQFADNFRRIRARGESIAAGKRVYDPRASERQDQHEIGDKLITHA